MTEPLPTPTTDVRRCVSDLESYGYCYLDAALSDTVLARLQQRLTEQAQAEEQLAALRAQVGAAAMLEPEPEPDLEAQGVSRPASPPRGSE